MDNQGLLFILDISGFTNFVSNTEIEDSRHITHELLELLIDSNPFELEISWAKADAILFHKFADTHRTKRNLQPG